MDRRRAPSPRPRLWTVASILLFLPLAALAAGCGGGGTEDEPKPEPFLMADVAPGPGLRVFQVDFEDDQQPFRDTTWGRVRIDPAVLAQTTGIQRGWLNLATDKGWAVVNLPLPPAGEPPFAVYFDLGLDQSQPLNQIELCVRHSNRAVESLEEEMGDTESFPAEAWAIDRGGLGPDGAPIPALPPPVLAASVRVVVPVTSDGWYQMTTNEQCANDQCLSMAIANALQYLENMGVLTIAQAHGPGLRGDATLVGVLDTYCDRAVTSRAAGDGLRFEDGVDGTFEYFSDEGLTGVLEHRHLDSGWASSLPTSDYTVFGSTTQYDGAVPTYAWIHARLGEGAGVVAGYQFPGGGHAVRITAAFEDDTGRQWVRYAHDALQTNRDPSDALGLENVVVRLQDLDGDGDPNLGTFDRNVRLVWAHGP